MKLGEIGETLAERYQLRQALGGGGLGEVFAAWDLRLRRSVAVKVFDSARAPRDKLGKLASVLDRASGVRHAAVVLPRIQVEFVKSPPFYVGEIVPGEDLGAFADRVGLVPWQRALEIAQTCTEGLAALAEATGAAHRDLKPGNIRILPDGAVRVLDFGVAELGVLPVPPDGSGAVEYRAPEQLEGSPGDASSDVFSLGVLLFQLMTGVHPFSGETSFRAAHKLLTLQDPLRVSDVVPHAALPSQVEGLLVRMLARRPADRLGDAVELGRHIALVRRSPGITPRGRGSVTAPSSEHEEITTPLKRIECPDDLTTAVRVPSPHSFKKAPPVEAPPAEADPTQASRPFPPEPPEPVPGGPRLLGADADTVRDLDLGRRATDRAYGEPIRASMIPGEARLALDALGTDDRTVRDLGRTRDGSARPDAVLPALLPPGASSPVAGEHTETMPRRAPVEKTFILPRDEHPSVTVRLEDMAGTLRAPEAIDTTLQLTNSTGDLGRRAGPVRPHAPDDEITTTAQRDLVPTGPTRATDVGRGPAPKSEPPTSLPTTMIIREPAAPRPRLTLKRALIAFNLLCLLVVLLVALWKS
jgi:serine/threonine protein kinase